MQLKAKRNTLQKLYKDNALNVKSWKTSDFNDLFGYRHDNNYDSII